MKIFQNCLIFVFISLFYLICTISPCLARTDNVFIGDVGERYMDYLHTSTYSFHPEKWEKIYGEIGRNGIDGLYVRRNKKGMIKKVLIGESKYGTSVLGKTKFGHQMSQMWVEKKVELLIKKTEKELGKSRHWKQRQRLEKTLKDYRSVKRHLSKGTVRKQVWKTRFKNGRLYVERRSVQDLDRNNVKLKKRKGYGELDKGIALSNDKINNMHSVKKRKFHLREREKFFTQIRRNLQQDGLSKHEIKKIINDTKNGKIANGRDLKKARNDAINKMSIVKFKKAIRKHAPKRFRKILSKYITLLGNNKTFRNLIGKSIMGVKIVGFVSAALEFKIFYDWINNKISNRQFTENTAMVVGGAAGYKVGQLIGEGVGYATWAGLKYFGVETDVNTTKSAGKAIGGFAGAAGGTLLAHKTASIYFDIKDEEAQRKYNAFLRKHLLQESL